MPIPRFLSTWECASWAFSPISPSLRGSEIDGLSSCFYGDPVKVFPRPRPPHSPRLTFPSVIHSNRWHGKGAALVENRRVWGTRSASRFRVAALPVPVRHAHQRTPTISHPPRSDSMSTRSDFHERRENRYPPTLTVSPHRKRSHAPISSRNGPPGHARFIDRHAARIGTVKVVFHDHEIRTPAPF